MTAPLRQLARTDHLTAALTRELGLDREALAASGRCAGAEPGAAPPRRFRPRR
ncbi:hypothetical protein [Streptomyces shenzhenensis]|uniref:hypothetical protein n=1 Tax=Streptomyces shenzhenensis TaxID=943815 RepID=UPI001604C71A|nr:hypothetical protein [Streptomyces shenzhenensis]